MPNVKKTVPILCAISVVPETSQVEPFGTTIAMAHEEPRDFYVVLSNVSTEPRPGWETWNSWGYQTISLELATADGKKFLASVRQQGFTTNVPSTFLIGPGEHQVYTIRLDKDWETHPSLPKAAETPITLKAIYENGPSPEAARYKVWLMQSRGYKLRQW